MSKSGKKEKNLVRDSFTMPAEEHQIIDQLKKKVRLAGNEVKKSELIRAGIAMLDTLSIRALMTAINRVPNLKTGRPAKDLAVKPVAPPKAISKAVTKAATKPTIESDAPSASRRPALRQQSGLSLCLNDGIGAVLLHECLVRIERDALARASRLRVLSYFYLVILTIWLQDPRILSVP